MDFWGVQYIQRREDRRPSLSGITSLLRRYPDSIEPLGMAPSWRISRRRST